MTTTTCRVRWTRRLALFATTGLLWFSTLALTAITRADSAFPEFRSAANQQSAVDYWTPERMRAAQPPTLPGVPPTPARAEMPLEGQLEDPDELEHETGILSQSDAALHPHTSTGKVFFTLNDFDHICSASAVSSAGRWGPGSRQLVVTAGHCLNDGFQGFASNFSFAPGYYDGVAPFGLWEAERLFTTNEWHSGQGYELGRDVGFAIVRGADEYRGMRLHDVVEPLDIAFTESYPEDGLEISLAPVVGGDRAIFGYGELNWGGEHPVRTLSQIDRLDSLYWPPTLGAPSTHTGGASGGPWIHNYEPGSAEPAKNILAGVNGYVYGGEDRIYAPQFDSLIRDLWVHSASYQLIPEPASLMLVGLGCGVIAARRRRHAGRTQPTLRSHFRCRSSSYRRLRETAMGRPQP